LEAITIGLHPNIHKRKSQVNLRSEMDFFKLFSETSPFKTTAPTKKSEKKKLSSNQNQSQSQNQSLKLDSNSSTGNENATASISTTSTTTTTSSATTTATIGPVKKKKTRTTFTGKKQFQVVFKNTLNMSLVVWGLFYKANIL
jgi:cytoskeletal protein RodZ